MSENGPVGRESREPGRVAALPTPWAEGSITVDEGLTVVQGQYRTDLRWNGWLCVRLTLDNAIRILTALTRGAEGDPEGLAFEMDGNVIVVREQGPEVEIYEPDADGMYSLGYAAWCWEEATDRMREQECGP